MFNFKEKIAEKENHIVVRSIVYSLLGVIFLLVLASLVVYANRGAIYESFSSEFRSTDDTAPSVGVSVDDTTGESRVEQVVQNALPSVVSVVATREVPTLSGNRFDGFRFNQDETREQAVGGGSGFFVSSDGLIVTNRHVVSADANYSIVTNDGAQYDVEVVARDPFIDIAFLRVEDRDGAIFQPLAFSENENPNLGQTAIAIGNALGQFQNTVSVGIVSGLSRSIVARGGMGVERLDHVIQTDAAVNPGNSGGPLLSLDGRVIGVNVAVAQDTENIAFAIPASFVSSLAESVRENGRIIRPFVGVRYTPAQATERGLENGAVISSSNESAPAVVPGSPADQAGLQEGDVIVSVNGDNVTERDTFGYLVRRYDVGDTVTLSILRNGEERQVELTLEEAPDDINQ